MSQATQPLNTESPLKPTVLEPPSTQSTSEKTKNLSTEHVETKDRKPRGRCKIPQGINQQNIRHITSTTMLTRFMTVNRREDPLRHETDLACLEKRVYDGQDMFAKLQIEQGWEEITEL